MMRIVTALLLTVISISVYANFNPQDMENLDPSNPGDVRVKFTSLDKPETVAELGGFAVVNTSKSEKCPAGGFYLVNLQRKTYQFVDAGTCAPDVFVQLAPPLKDRYSVATQILSFVRGGAIIARYPLYGY